MNSAEAIQIITTKNRSFKFHPEKLGPIFERDDLKDRQAVIVSIAGAYRKGKSFLLNFFLKYLYAQYKRHDVSDWISEYKDDSALGGFKSQCGPYRATVGIWMWSDIFTHDFDNGNKVAIVLLDTQGIFDDESTIKECTAVFAISMMISSTQCYNLMQNIQEDDLQHLQLFTEYGRLAAANTSDTPFQNLIFIVRDWPNPNHFEFGNCQQFVDTKLRGNDQQEPEKRQLRYQIRDSFDRISGFLLPYPGADVAERTWSGRLEQVDARFIKYVKELVPSIFSPKNIAVKTVNGQKLRIRDLMTYLQTYVDTFNSDDLPEPKTVFVATASASNQVLHSECVNIYVELMENSLSAVPFLSETDLKTNHTCAKNVSLVQFQEQRKLGDDKMIESFRKKLESEIDFKYQSFERRNTRQRNDYNDKTNLQGKVMELEEKIKNVNEVGVVGKILQCAGELAPAISGVLAIAAIAGTAGLAGAVGAVGAAGLAEAAGAVGFVEVVELFPIALRAFLMTSAPAGVVVFNAAIKDAWNELKIRLNGVSKEESEEELKRKLKEKLNEELEEKLKTIKNPGVATQIMQFADELAPVISDMVAMAAIAGDPKERSLTEAAIRIVWNELEEKLKKKLRDKLEIYHD